MDIIIQNTSGKPIYEQITAQIKNQILSGALQAGDALPSMRLLAKELRISVITTKRAYEELERDGFLVTVTGKGQLCGRAERRTAARRGIAAHRAGAARRGGHRPPGRCDGRRGARNA